MVEQEPSQSGGGDRDDKKQARVGRFEADVITPPTGLDPEVLKNIPLDVLPGGRVRGDGRFETPAIVGLDQLEALVAAGATVVLRSLAPRAFPRERIMSDDTAFGRLRDLEQAVRRAAESEG